MYLLVCFRVFVCALLCRLFCLFSLILFFPFFPFFFFVFVFHIPCVSILFFLIIIFLRDHSPLWQGFPPETGRRILLVLFSPQGAHRCFFFSPPSPLSLVLQCSVSVGCKPKHRLSLCHSLLALGRSLKTLGPSLIAAAVCLRALGEKAELELQGRLKALLLQMSTEFLLGKVRKSQSRRGRSQAPCQCLLWGLLAKNNPQNKQLQSFCWTYSL